MTTSIPVGILDLTALANYRRPVLQWNSITEVDVETNAGTGGNDTTKIIFPDGDVRTVVEAYAGDQYRRFNITQTASLVATHNSGLRSGESEANNTWYAIYAVKTTDDATKFVMVGTVTQPIYTNVSTLDGYFGTNGWVYLGMICNGNAFSSGDILKFNQVGNRTFLTAVETYTYGGSGAGLQLAGNTASTLTWTYATGTSGLVVPTTVKVGVVNFGIDPSATGQNISILRSDTTRAFLRITNGDADRILLTRPLDLTEGFYISAPASIAMHIGLEGFDDSALGIGSNPLI
jgi:hypothetical protein